MNQCSTNYNVELVPLAFDLVKDGLVFSGDTVVNIDATLKQALNSNDFQKKLNKAIQDYTNIVIQKIKAGKQIDVAGARAVLDAGMEAYGEAIENAVTSNPKMDLLKQEANAFKSAFECSPTGIWVNENKTMLIVMGVIGVVGGVAYMYKNRTGDTIASLSKDQLKKTWKVGTIDLNTKVTNLKPSNREFGLEFSASSKWKQFNTNITLSFLAQNDIISVSSKSSVAVALSTDKTLSLGMTQKSDNSTLSLPLASKNSFSTDINAFVHLAYKNESTTMKLGMNVGTNKNPSYFLSLQMRF